MRRTVEIFLSAFGFIRTPSLHPVTVATPSEEVATVAQPSQSGTEAVEKKNSGSTYSIDVAGWIPGWYMLECSEAVNDKRAGHYSVSLTFGTSTETEVRHHIPLAPNLCSKRILLIPRETKYIHVEFSDTALRPTHIFRFVWLTPSFAKKRIYKRLSSNNFYFRERNFSEIDRNLHENSRRLRMPWKSVADVEYRNSFEPALPDNPVAYLDWHLKMDECLCQEARRINKNLGGNSIKPSFIILFCADDAKFSLKEAFIHSVLDQTYENWELAMTLTQEERHGNEVLIQTIESRTKRVTFLPAQESMSKSSWVNMRMDQSKCEFAILLDHPVKLQKNAFSYFAQIVSNKKDSKLIYCDGDACDENGLRSKPQFKPAWNLDFSLSKNFLSPLVALHIKSILQIGGIREAANQAWLYDSALNINRNFEDGVSHIPRVLYSKLEDDHSKTEARAEFKGTHRAERSAIIHHLKCMGDDAKVESGIPPGSHRIIRKLPNRLPLVSLIVPTRDGIEILKPCVESTLTRTNYSEFELLIIDNQSTCPETLEYLREIQEKDDRVRVLKWNFPYNYSAINNYGVKKSKGEIIGLLNNDVEAINPEWLDEMVSHAVRPDIGCVGAKLYYPDGRIQHGGVILGLGGVAGHSHRFSPHDAPGYMDRLSLVQNLSAVTAACLLVKKVTFQEAGGLDEKNLPIAYNDIDLCLKVRELGLRNVWTPYAELFHHESATRGSDDTPAKKKRYRREVAFMKEKWGSKLNRDPAYNPNLTLSSEDFSLAKEPRQ